MMLTAPGRDTASWANTEAQCLDDIIQRMSVRLRHLLVFQQFGKILVNLLKCLYTNTCTHMKQTINCYAKWCNWASGVIKLPPGGTRHNMQYYTVEQGIICLVPPTGTPHNMRCSEQCSAPQQTEHCIICLVPPTGTPHTMRCSWPWSAKLPEAQLRHLAYFKLCYYVC